MRWQHFTQCIKGDVMLLLFKILSFYIPGYEYFRQLKLKRFVWLCVHDVFVVSIRLYPSAKSMFSTPYASLLFQGLFKKKFCQVFVFEMFNCGEMVNMW